MSVLRIKSNNLDVELVIDSNNESPVIQQGATAAPQPNSEESLHVALIALALENMFEQDSTHDRESGIITIQQRPTEWNAKVFGFTNINF